MVILLCALLVHGPIKYAGQGLAENYFMQIVAGLDEGVASMRAGGVRRIYIPGNLSFPKGLASGPGR